MSLFNAAGRLLRHHTSYRCSHSRHARTRWCTSGTVFQWEDEKLSFSLNLIQVSFLMKCYSDRPTHHPASTAAIYSSLYVFFFFVVCLLLQCNALHQQSFSCPGAAELSSYPGCVGGESGYFLDKWPFCFRAERGHIPLKSLFNKARFSESVIPHFDFCRFLHSSHLLQT